MRRGRLALAPALLLVSALASASGTGLPSGLAGLLSPAQVPDGAPGCVRASTKQRLAVHTGPDEGAERVGALVFRPWREPEQGCEAVEARLEPTGGGEPEPVATLESSYEVAALPVLEARGDWLRVALGDGSGWVRRPADASYEPFPVLLRDKLAYTTADWDRELCRGPGESCRRVDAVPEQPVRVVAERQRDGEAWIEVELTTDVCRGDEPKVIARGWMRAHGDGDRPAAWFHSRGC